MDACMILILFVAIYMTLWSNFLKNRINFVLEHMLSPCHQQRLLQVYWKMFTYRTDGIVAENFIFVILYMNYSLFYFVLFIPMVLLYS